MKLLVKGRERTLLARRAAAIGNWRAAAADTGWLPSTLADRSDDRNIGKCNWHRISKGAMLGSGNVTGVELLADKNAQGKNSANRASWPNQALARGDSGRVTQPHAKGRPFDKRKNNDKIKNKYQKWNYRVL